MTETAEEKEVVYRLIQFVINKTSEVINVGLSFSCSDLAMHRVDIDEEMKRVLRFFGENSFDREQATADIEKIKELLSKHNVDLALRFAKGRFDRFKMTDPKMIKVQDFGETFRKFWSELCT